MSKNWILFRSFLLAGTFTFAGGIAMLPALQKDIVDKYQLMSKEAFLDDATMAQAIPGVIGLNFAVLTGKKVNGNSGMMVAAAASILPAFVLMLLATILYQYIPQEGGLQFAFIGVRAASTSAVLMAAYSLSQHIVKSIEQWVLVVLCFGAVGILNIGAPYVIITAGLLSLVMFMRKEA